METLERMLLFSDTSHSDYDVAAANLSAAAGLRGAEDIDFGAILSWLDSAARAVQLETLRYSDQFHRNPSEFQNSPAYFCMLVMATVLCRDFGVRYNPARIRDPKFQDPNCIDPDFSDSRDLFIHGMITGPGGTCASMPVLYLAVGRRLGYPLKLVRSKGHLFVRWDDPQGEVWQPGARFNIEATCPGLACQPDEHYRNWPIALSDMDLASGAFLRSLSPRAEAAEFRSTRGICLWENCRYGDALLEFGWAAALEPNNPYHARDLLVYYKQYREIMVGKSPAVIDELAMPREAEIELQKWIERGHNAEVRAGGPGFPLAEYGIHPNALPDRAWQVPNPPDRVFANRNLSAASTSPSMPRHLSQGTMCAAPSDGLSPVARQATEHSEKMQRLMEFNRQNQERVRRRQPGLNPMDFGL